MEEKLYYIVGDLVEEDGPDCDRSAVMYKTRSLARAISFLQSFREGLSGFYVERNGSPLNAFNVAIWDSESIPKGLLSSIDGKDILEVPDPSEVYSKKIICFDFSADGKSDRNTGLPWDMGINSFHLSWYGKCMTVASVILSKMADPAGEFANDGDELKFGKDLLEKGFELMPSQGWAMDQVFLVTDISTDEDDPDDSVLLQYKEKALKIVEDSYGKD